MSMTTARWLDADEKKTWTGFLAMWPTLEGVIARELARDGLSIADYELLVPLSEAPRGEMRARDLAREVGWDKARLSKYVARMDKRGLVSRHICHTDNRGSVVRLTRQGREAIESAAPHHVETVRRYFFDLLTPSEARVLDGIMAKMSSRAAKGWDG